MRKNIQIRIHNGRGTVEFGREGFILHEIDTGASILTDGITTGREVTFSAYILPSGESADKRARQMENLSRRVRRIVTDADGFTLTVGDRSILLTAKSAPIFAHEAPLNGDEVCFFTVRARAKNASASYFSGTKDTLSVGRGFLGELVFPMAVTEETRFGSSVSEGVFFAENPGDVPCGFAATVTAHTGDVESFTLRAESGEAISLVYPIPKGKSIVIDTRPGRKSVTADGVSILSALTWESEFFTLAPGENRLDFSCTGGGSVVVSLRVMPLYH